MAFKVRTQIIDSSVVPGESGVPAHTLFELKGHHAVWSFYAGSVDPNSPTRGLRAEGDDQKVSSKKRYALIRFMLLFSITPLLQELLGDTAGAPWGEAVQNGNYSFRQYLEFSRSIAERALLQYLADLFCAELNISNNGREVTVTAANLNSVGYVLDHFSRYRFPAGSKADLFGVWRRFCRLASNGVKNTDAEDLDELQRLSRKMTRLRHSMGKSGRS